jgi:hypothetical protein
MDAKFIEERKIFLNMFLKLLANIPYLWCSEELDIFIRSTNPDIEKVNNIVLVICRY